jgi:hypothetical protein
MRSLCFECTVKEFISANDWTLLEWYHGCFVQSSAQYVHDRLFQNIPPSFVCFNFVTINNFFPPGKNNSLKLVLKLSLQSGWLSLWFSVHELKSNQQWFLTWTSDYFIFTLSLIYHSSINTFIGVTDYLVEPFAVKIPEATSDKSLEHSFPNSCSTDRDKNSNCPPASSNSKSHWMDERWYSYFCTNEDVMWMSKSVCYFLFRNNGGL